MNLSTCKDLTLILEFRYWRASNYSPTWPNLIWKQNRPHWVWENQFCSFFTCGSETHWNWCEGTNPQWEDKFILVGSLLWEVLICGSMRKPAIHSSANFNLLPWPTYHHNPHPHIRWISSLYTTIILSRTWCTSPCSSWCTARTGKSCSGSSTGTPSSPPTRPPSLSRSIIFHTFLLKIFLF